MRAYAAGLRGAELGALTDLEGAVAEIMERVETTSGPWWLTVRGSGVEEKIHGDARIRRKMLRLGERLKVGDRLDLRPVKGQRTFVIRCSAWKLGIAPAIPKVGATDAIERAWVFAFEETGRIALKLGRDLVYVQQGIANCRKIDGTQTWSQHAWANGLDGHIANRATGKLDDQATTILAERMRERGFAAEVLWHVSGHFGHLHVTGAPKRSGVPPCAS